MVVDICFNMCSVSEFRLADCSQLGDLFQTDICMLNCSVPMPLIVCLCPEVMRTQLNENPSFIDWMIDFKQKLIMDQTVMVGNCLESKAIFNMCHCAYWC